MDWGNMRNGLEALYFLDNALTDPSEEYLRIIEKEENEAYTKPMLYFTPLQFPDLAREQILRLMVDILFILEKKEDMYKIINSLKNKNYKNVKDKIKRS